MTDPEFKPGFRISATDVTFLVLGALGASGAAAHYPWLSLVIVFTVGHFFLFCNVVRMDRSLELAWASVFLILAGCTLTVSTPGWQVTFLASLLGTAVVVLVQIRKPSYHGVAWAHINPDLPLWWESIRGPESHLP